MDGRKNFHGPQIDIAALKDGEVVGMEPAITNDGVVEKKVEG